MARIPFLLGHGDLHPPIFSIVLIAPVLLALSQGPGASSSFPLLLVYHLQQVAYLSLALDSSPHVNKPVLSVSQEIFFAEGSTSKWVALSVKNCNYYEAVAAATYNSLVCSGLFFTLLCKGKTVRESFFFQRVKNSRWRESGYLGEQFPE